MLWLMWPAEWYLNAGVLLLALTLDLALREPPAALHPVVWMGKAISILERLSPKDGRIMSFLAGAGIALVVPAAFGGVTWLVAVGLRELHPVAYLIGGAVLLKTTFAVKGLNQAASMTARAIESEEIDEARYSLRSLVSRDARTLTPPLMAAAAVESVAENTTDSYIAPWLAFAVLGLPGAFAYRALNTLDSMIGYRGRYEYLGKASARLDDLANLVPARLSAALMLAAGGLACLPIHRGWATLMKEHSKTESPNAGWTISAMSGLLGVVLEKTGHYRIGDGFREPTSLDIRLSVRVASLVAFLGLMAAIGIMAARQALV
jgi:adenosylcobinamide-phosphate synthase